MQKKFIHSLIHYNTKNAKKNWQKSKSAKFHIFSVKWLHKRCCSNSFICNVGGGFFGHDSDALAMKINIYVRMCVCVCFCGAFHILCDKYVKTPHKIYHNFKMYALIRNSIEILSQTPFIDSDGIYTDRLENKYACVIEGERERECVIIRSSSFWILEVSINVCTGCDTIRCLIKLHFSWIELD